MSIRKPAVILTCFLALLSTAWAGPPGSFSLTGLKGWKLQTFGDKRATEYTLTRDAGTQVLHAQCSASAAGYLSRSRIDLLRTPVLSWRWKVDALYTGLDERSRGGDDFPARVYVVLDGGWKIWKTRTLVYAWAGNAVAGSHWPSPYTSQAHMVAVRAGPAGLGQWQQESRNVREDFQRYFGQSIDHVDGVAIMTDCDDGGGSTSAWYGDLGFAAP